MRKQAKRPRGRPRKPSASRRNIRIADAIWLAYRAAGDGDATRGIERVGIWLPHLLPQLIEAEGWAREMAAREE